jgi:hypothetical protein
VNWEGSEFRARLYDKGKQLRIDSEKVIRLEFQMRGTRLKDIFKINGLRLRPITFEHCYHVFRKLALGFSPRPIPKISGKAHEIAIGLKQGWNVNGLDYFDFRMQGKCAGRVREMRKQVAALRFEYWNIDWEELLPVDNVPPVVEVQLRRRIRKPKNKVVPMPAKPLRLLPQMCSEDDAEL